MLQTMVMDLHKAISSMVSAVGDEPGAQARARVLAAAREFFDIAHAPRPFVPGQTYIPVTAKVLDAQDLLYLIDASLDLWLTSGRFAREMESRLPTLMNRQVGALLVNSGSSANLLAISSLGSPLLPSLGRRPLERDDQVITVAAGFPTTLNPIIQNGWVPVFVDVELRTLNVTPELVMAARTPKTRAVVLAHTLGNPYRADVLADWCRREGLYLVEDCCDALGATIGPSQAGVMTAPVGSFGDYATLSFYPAHHITTGEGGAVVPADGRLKRAAESLRDWGRDCWCDTGKDNTCGKRFAWEFEGLPHGYDHKYVYSSVGYNLKMTDMQAAIGVSQLGKLDRFVAARRANWRTLYDGVCNSPLLRDSLIPVEPTEGTEPSWFGFPVHCADGIDRSRLVRYLEEHKVATRLLFGSNLTRQPAYHNVEFRIHGELTASDEIVRRTFWIGVHPALDRARLCYMLEQLEAGVRAQRL